VSGFWDGSATDCGTAVGTVGLALITTVAAFREAKDRRELKAERDAARARTELLEQQNVQRAQAEAAPGAGSAWLARRSRDAEQGEGTAGVAGGVSKRAG